VHYREDRQWTDNMLSAGEKRLATWREAAAAPTGPDAHELLARVRAALAADLDTPGALSLVDAWAAAALAGSGTEPAAPELMKSTVDALLGIAL